MKRMTTMIYLATTLLLFGIMTNCSRAADPEKQGQLIVDTAPPIPNGVNVGGVSIGIVDFVRKSNRALVGLVIRRINESWFPGNFSLVITDDRGNEYDTQFRPYVFLAMPSVGSTWTRALPIGVRIPEIAPISKFELIPDTEGMPDELRGTIPEKLALDYQKLTPIPALSLDFKIEAEQILTGREIKQSEHVSIWFGEPKVVEETDQEEPFEKTISVSMPITIENRDYNPRTAEGRLQFYLQLSTGRILSDYTDTEFITEFILDLNSTTVEAVSKKTVECSFKAKAEEDEHVQLVWVDRWPPDIPVPGVFATSGDRSRSPKLWGFLFSKRVTASPEMALALPIRSLPPRKPVPPDLQDGDWFPDGSKIVFSKQTYTEDTGWFGKKLLYRIFVMNSDGTDEKEIGLKQAPQETIDSIGSEEHVAPLVSPDGQKIAFVVDRADHSASIYIMGADGSNIQRISPGSYDSLAFAWISNDKVVFWESHYGFANFDINLFYESGKVYILDINKRKIQKLNIPPPELLEGKFVSGILKVVVEDLQKSR